MKTVCIAAATRPDLIKLAPVINIISKDVENFNTIVLYGKQHTDLAEQVLKIFRIFPDYISDNIPEDKLNLPDMLSFFINFYKDSFDNIQQETKIDALIVHGDVLNSLAAALTAFLLKIPVYHIEAGLRTQDFTYPFPEEATRRMISKIASFHFAPTWKAKENLIKEGIDPLKIIITGNTIVDAVNLIRELKPILFTVPILNHDSSPVKPIILMTLHRREMWNSPLFFQYLECIGKFAEEHSEYDYVFPVHPNPNITNAVKGIQERVPSTRHIRIVNPPFTYDNFIGLLDKHVELIITDSGGVLEESSIFGIPVLVLRNDTERPEAHCKIIGEDISLLRQALDNFAADEANRVRNPSDAFGDGKASERIYNYFLNN